MKKFKTLKIFYDDENNELINLLNEGWIIENSCSISSVQYNNYGRTITKFPFINYVLSKNN